MPVRSVTTQWSNIGIVSAVLVATSLMFSRDIVTTPCIDVMVFSDRGNVGNQGDGIRIIDFRVLEILEVDVSVGCVLYARSFVDDDIVLGRVEKTTFLCNISENGRLSRFFICFKEWLFLVIVADCTVNCVITHL